MKRFAIMLFPVILISCGTGFTPEETDSVQSFVNIVKEVKTMEYNPITEGLHIPEWLLGKKFKNSYGFDGGIQLPQPALLMCVEGTATVDFKLFNKGREVVEDERYILEIELDPSTNKYGYGGDVKIDIERINEYFYLNDNEKALEEE